MTAALTLDRLPDSPGPSSATIDPLLAHSREFRWDEDPAGRIVGLGASAAALWGLGPAALLGQPLEALFGTETVAGLRALPPGEPWPVARQVGGTERHFELRRCPRHDPGGPLLGHAGLARELSDTVVLTQRLRRLEGQTLALADSASEGVAVIQDRRFRYLNRHLQAIVGLPAEALLDRPFVDFIHQDDRGLLLENHRRRLQGQAVPARYEFRMNVAGQGVRWLEMSGALIEWEGRPATINHISDVTERKQQDERVRQLAFVDALTGLPNRRLLEDRLQTALAHCRRSRHHGALLFLDLDHFKPLNDTHGHAAGDQLLIGVGQRLRRAVRGCDSVARLGGDEFVVMLSPLPAEREAAAVQAQAVAEKLRRVLAEPHRLEACARGPVVEHRVTASLGVALFGPDDVQAEQLLRQADQAMYQAKSAGRNRVGPQSRPG